MKKEKNELKTIENKVPVRKFKIELQDNLFIEEWSCEYQHDWMGSYHVFENGEEFHTHHLEFRGEPGSLSESGYLSHFINGNSEKLKLEDLQEIVSSLLEGNKNVTVLDIKEVEK